MQDKPNAPVKILAVASSGGHWVQLMRIRPAWHGQDVAYLTTDVGYADDVFTEAALNGQPRPRFYTTVAANRWQKVRLVRQLIKIAWVVLKERPDVVCSTGAAPGYFAIRMGKLLGAKTIWIDSIANVETVSMAGARVARHADAWLTQWEALAESEKQTGQSPEYWGAVL